MMEVTGKQHGWHLKMVSFFFGRGVVVLRFRREYDYCNCDNIFLKIVFFKYVVSFFWKR